MSKFILFILFCPLAWAEPQPLDLAKKFAPIVTQGIGSEPLADEFTRVDYDGDWNGENNWEHLKKFPHPPTVYWSVIESEKHYFITYAFFFPRDYSGLCFWVHCHENDFEGMRVVIEKPDTLLRLEALAHNRLSVQEKPSGVHVMIESEGHGIHPAQQSNFEANHKTYVPFQYELRPLDEIWEQRKSNLFAENFKFKDQDYPAHFRGSKWILFGMGSAKPPWAWEIWGSSWKKGEWFLDPLKGTEERYLFHPYQKP